MRSRIRSVAVAALAFVFYSCSENSVTGPDFDKVDSQASVIAPPAIVISQVYGGGGNINATYKNDFVELFNPGTSSVNVGGWAIYYGAATATSAWSAGNSTTIPAGAVIQPGQYFLIQLAAGSIGAALPTADANGGINMSAVSGKLILANGPISLATVCPSDGTIVDRMSFGTTGCSTAWTSAPLGSSNNTTSVIRKNAGCEYTANMAADFTTASPPTPRNKLTTLAPCGTVVPPGTVATVSVSTTTPSVQTGDKPQFTAKAFDNATPPAEIAGVTFTWTSSNTSIATVDGTGLVTTLTAGDVLISAKSPNNITGTASLHITDPPPPPPFADVVISQVYGGGGNGGGLYSNDFIELYNRSDAPVDLTGWAVQYVSAGGSSWNATPLTGSIAPHKYFLVQEAAGTNVFAALPTPDATGTLALNGTAGKIALTRTAAALNTACPVGGVVNDQVGYGSNTTATGCATEWNGRSRDLSNSTAAWRDNDGCTDTNSGSFDFVVLAPEPRNSASASPACTEPVRGQSSATVVINELMQDPVNAESASWGQWFEVYNYGSAPVDLNGWTIATAGSSQPDHVINASVVVPAGGYALLGRGGDIGRNGGVALDYNYFIGSSKTIWLDSHDFLMLVDNANARVDSVAWTSMPHGVTKGLRNAAVENADVDGPNWGFSTDTFGQGDFGTPKASNEPLANTPPAVSLNHISISGRVGTDAPLPVGFEAQIFASLLNQSNVVISGPTSGITFTWSSLTPSIASVDPTLGVIRSLSPGTAVFRVVASDGTVKNHSLVMEAGTLGTAPYGNNTEFGDPVDNTPGDESVVRRPQFTTSYNQFKGRPNWVSYNLNGSNFQSGTDRCNCFTHDPLLPGSFMKLTTADYTGAGTFAAAGRTPPAGWSYGIDRGHMTRSSDRTNGTIDNATTYYLSNVVPQFADLNQGPWNVMEGDLHAMAGTGTKEIYIITGPAGINDFTTPGSNGTVKNEGKIEIPKSTWKIALIMPRGTGLANVHSASDVQIIAVDMPNRPGVRNEDWHQWEVSVDSLERLTGYNFLAALPDNIEAVVEGRTRAPISQPGGPYTAVEGSLLAFDGSASSDPDNDPLTFSWNFGDGSSGTGVTTSHIYVDNGNFAAILTATDPAGASDATDTPVTITNAAPVVNAGSNFIANTGQSYTLAGSFSDAGASDSPWTYEVAWGDGLTTGGSTSSQGGISSSHTYATAGSYSVTVKVTDKDGGSGTSTASATVRSAPVAVVNGPYTSNEGGSVAMSGAASADADGTIASYAWNFGDGATGTGATAAHTYVNDGNYTVTLVVTDNDGLSGTVTTTATVANVGPAITHGSNSVIPSAGNYTASGSFTDAGADTWTATVDYGDGSGSSNLVLSGKTFNLVHHYAAGQTYTVTVTVADDDVSVTDTYTVRVQAEPVANAGGPYSSNEGSSVAMSAAASSDVDGSIASYAWTFGDGGTASGASVSHTYTQNGTFTATLTVTDNEGLTATTTATVQVANVGAVISSFAGATLLRGESYSAASSFADPGSDTWTATVNYGDGSGTSALSLSGKNFSLAHIFNTAGTFTVTVTVNDGTSTSTSTATVVVKTAAQGVGDAISIVNQFVADGKLSNGNGNSLTAKLNAALNQIGNGNTNAALNQLNAALNEINSMVNTGKLSTADANLLRAAINRVIASIS